MSTNIIYKEKSQIRCTLSKILTLIYSFHDVTNVPLSSDRMNSIVEYTFPCRNDAMFEVCIK